MKNRQKSCVLLVKNHEKLSKIFSTVHGTVDMAQILSRYEHKKLGGAVAINRD